MRSLKNSFTAGVVSRCSLIILTFLVSSFVADAQHAADSCDEAVAANKKEIIIKEPNVVFPEILKGEEDNSVAYIEKFSSRRRDYLIRMHEKGKKLLPKAATVFRKYSLPEELRVLMTLESAYNGNAVSRAGAVGYWQFMDAVAREYGLKVATQMSAAEKKKLKKQKGKKAAAEMAKLSRQKDDRKNFNKATIAAARYLRDRKVNLDGNWLLVVASYNCGVGNVWEAMKKSRKENPTFWDIKKLLPSETQAYVMNFITLNVIFHNYENFVKNKLIFTSQKITVPEDEEEDEYTAPVTEPTASRLK